MSKFEFKPKLFLDLRGYNKEKLTADIMAGLIVGIVALPLAIAFGIASGVTPERASSRPSLPDWPCPCSAGAVCKSAARRVLYRHHLWHHPAIRRSGPARGYRHGRCVPDSAGRIPSGYHHQIHPLSIVVGFTSGIAVTIFTTQIKDLFGLTIDNVPADFIEKWIVYIRHFGSLDVWSTVVGIVSVAIIASLPN